ncbi:MAG: GNAT family N-acetyltransferase [Parachlamydiaceae bacterium]
MEEVSQFSYSSMIYSKNKELGIELTTSRLHLRNAREQDVEDIALFAGQYEVVEMMNGSIPYPYEVEEARKWVDKHVKDNSLSPAISWIIASSDNGQLIGSIQLRRNQKQARLSYWIAKPYWGKGFAAEAGRAIIDFGFKNLGLEKIEAEHFRRNPASGRVLNKLNFEFVCSIRKRDNRGYEEDFEQYILDKKSYFNKS